MCELRRNNLFTSLKDKLEIYNLNRDDYNQIYEDDDKNMWVCSWGSGVFKISCDGRVENFRITGTAP